MSRGEKLAREVAIRAFAIAIAFMPCSHGFALELVMFDADWCQFCRKFENEVLP